MRLSWLLSIPGVLGLAIERRDADFKEVRTKMNKDLSGRKGDTSGKYFHESVFHPHYDGRFADRQLSYHQRKQALSNLMQTYLSTMADLGVETWLMHGTLLGWWWNRKIMPWDSDSDVQVSESSIHYLAAYYNMTIFHYKTPRIPDGRDYLLEINPHYTNREQTDKMNVIDARWIDTTSGVFIDITTARYNTTHPSGPGIISCKDGHEYRDTYIFPLRESYFEGVPAKVPFAYKELLEAEYRPKALTNTEFENHKFDEQKLEWIPVLKKTEPVRPEDKIVIPPRPQKKVTDNPAKEQKTPEPAKQGEKQPETKAPPTEKVANNPVKEQKTPEPFSQGDKQPEKVAENPVKDQNPVKEQKPPEPVNQGDKQPENPAPPAEGSKKESSDAPADASKPARVIPNPPNAQTATEQKIVQLQEKKEMKMRSAEEDRKIAELKDMAKREAKLDKERKADDRRLARQKTAEDRKVAEEKKKAAEKKAVDAAKAAENARLEMRGSSGARNR